MNETTMTKTAKQVATLAELAELNNPPAESVLETLEDYATGGWEVRVPVVLSIINQAGFTRDELVQARQYAIKGRDVQRDRLNTEAEEEYSRVAARISFILDSFD